MTNDSTNYGSTKNGSTIPNYLMSCGSKKNGWTNCASCSNEKNLNAMTNYGSKKLSWTNSNGSMKNVTNCCVTNCCGWTKPNLKSCYGSTKNENLISSYCWNCGCWNYGSTNYENCCCAMKMNANLTAAFLKNCYLSGSMIWNLTNCYGSMTSGWNSNASCWTPNYWNLNDCCSNGWMNFGSMNCGWKKSSYWKNYDCCLNGSNSNGWNWSATTIPSCWMTNGWKNCGSNLNAKSCYGCSIPNYWMKNGSKKNATTTNGCYCCAKSLNANSKAAFPNYWKNCDYLKLSWMNLNGNLNYVKNYSGCYLNGCSIPNWTNWNANWNCAMNCYGYCLTENY